MVGLLDEQAISLRAELIELRRSLADARSDLDGTRTVQLQQANEKLLLAALRAEALADAAAANVVELTHSNQRDPLTGVPNRTLLLDRLQNGIAVARRHRGQVAVLFVDLDHFKSINDNFGHFVGDEVLKQVAQSMQSTLRECDTVGRYGGDEFLVLLPEIATPADAGHLAARLLAELSRVGEDRADAPHISASIGISIFPEDADDAITLIHQADAAMYRCKGHGPGSYGFHSEFDALPLLMPSKRVIAQEARQTPYPVAPRTQDLREANEKLVLATMLAQEAETLARRAEIQAKEAHQQQVKFMAMVAHELRNPLTPLRIAADLLTHRQPNGEIPIERLQVMINGQVTHMMRLIDDLVEGSRLSTGRLLLQRRTVDLVTILEKVALMCGLGMRERNQHFTVTLPPGPIEIYGDPVRLEQIFSNLLSNACKYTPEGGEISLNLEKFQTSVVIAIEDSGIGISPEALPVIFELFVQDARALRHSDGGLGIGLAIVRDLVTAHSGSVTGRSAGPYHGSTFAVTLPLL
jgi:diguanylate cyclase (GGDEF)-like protein